MDLFGSEAPMPLPKDKSKGGGGGAKEATAASKARQGGNIKVCVRMRPMNKKERKAKNGFAFRIDSETSIVERVTPVIGPDQDTPRDGKRFNYDSVFGMKSSNEEVYSKIAAPIVAGCLGA